MKAKLKKSDDQTNIDKYIISQFHIIAKQKSLGKSILSWVEN